VYVVELETRALQSYSFAARGRVPVSHFWDATEPKLLVCETRSVDTLTGSPASLSPGVSSSNGGNGGAAEATSFFATPFDGLCLHDTMSLPLDRGGLLGLAAPYLLLVRRPEQRRPGLANQGLAAVSLRTFVGLEDSNQVCGCWFFWLVFGFVYFWGQATLSSLLNFSYFLTIGNMDAAFNVRAPLFVVLHQTPLTLIYISQAVSAIKSQAVWENMAHMCVGTKRLDVALVCLGKMGAAAAVRALRQVMASETDKGVQVAELAVQLGLYAEAEKLYQVSEERKKERNDWGGFPPSFFNIAWGGGLGFFPWTGIWSLRFA
jgi:intraflagellar transport protein 140